jgi:methyltransferase-like protein
MKVRVNYSIQYIADEVKANYPSVLALQESLHTYNQISSQMTENSAKIVARLRRDVQNIIVQGFNYLWTHKTHHKTQIQGYVKKLADKVLELETAVNGLNECIS